MLQISSSALLWCYGFTQMLRFALFFFATSSSSSSKSRAVQRICFLFKSIFYYNWFQHNFKVYHSISLHVDGKFYIYGVADKICCRKIAAFLFCVWMKNAARNPWGLWSKSKKCFKNTAAKSNWSDFVAVFLQHCFAGKIEFAALFNEEATYSILYPWSAQHSTFLLRVDGKCCSWPLSLRTDDALKIFSEWFEC